MNRILLIFLITYVTGQAQSIYRNDQHLLFKEAKSSQPILIIKDSLVYKGNPLRQKTFLHSPYLDNLKAYVPFQIGPKNYLVHNGCGPVLEWRNDSIVRIDHSFLHLNQINSTPFIYNNEIYFFGGYGLFTFKNLLTKYSFKTKEWNEVETLGTPPSPRRSAIGIVINQDLFIFDGFEKDPSHFLQIIPCKTIVYKLHLPSMEWSTIGDYSSTPHFNLKDDVAISFTANNKLYIIPLMEYTHVYEIDLKNNTITTFKGNTKNVQQPYFDTSTKEVVYLNKNADGLKNLVRTPLQEFLGKQVDQQAFILPWYLSLNPITLITIILGVLLVLILILYFNKRKSHFVPFNGITFHTTNAIFYYRGKPLDTLDNAELRILNYLVQNKQRFIPLNELNHLYENEIQIDNFTTVVKRRETALSNLLAKLVFITENTEENIIVYRKNPNDKRVKEIKLKEHFIKIK